MNERPDSTGFSVVAAGRFYLRLPLKVTIDIRACSQIRSHCPTSQAIGETTNSGRRQKVDGPCSVVSVQARAPFLVRGVPKIRHLLHSSDGVDCTGNN